jgi:hypothetical protein
MKPYHQFSGDVDLELFFLGGATYARAFNNWVAFGSIFPGELLTEYEPNGRVVMEYMFKAMKI